MACRKPAELGLPLVRWSCRSLAARLVEDEVFTEVHYTTIYLLLAGADLRPHRVLYWKRSHDPLFVEKAVHVLWYYEMAASLRARGEWVFCLDEKTQVQLLGRDLPDLPMRPGCPLRREHEYIRHGTGNLLLVHDVVTGRLFGEAMDLNRGPRLTAALDRHLALLPGPKDAPRVHYVMDNGPTHDSAHTRAWLAARGGRVRFHFTPTGASWLNQGECALSRFSRRYLRDRAWDGPGEFPGHVQASIDHHNQHYASPLDWSFTRNRFREWNRCRTSSTGH
ncbi:MAG TPA: IS630 family transposase [Azospirillaceae bacterium]|nr:IS630 family transposase [Azospirillaceae bacterium]